jgi:hypothetical protein
VCRKAARMLHSLRGVGKAKRHYLYVGLALTRNAVDSDKRIERASCGQSD